MEGNKERMREGEREEEEREGVNENINACESHVQNSTSP